MKTRQQKNKLLLWDFDGVIADSFKPVSQAILAAARTSQLPVKTEEDVRYMYETNFFDGLTERGMSRDEIAFFMKRIQHERSEKSHAMSPFPHIDHLLSKLFGMYHMVIISSGTSEEIHTFLKQHALNELFQQVLGRDAGYSKTEKIERILTQTHTPLTVAYYIGDTAGDIHEAKAAHVQTIGVTWGYHAEDLLKSAEPDYIVHTLKELEKILL